MTLQSRMVITSLQTLLKRKNGIDEAARVFVSQSEPKVHELVSELVNDPEQDYSPILRKWARTYPDYQEAVSWIMANLDVPTVVEALRRETRARGAKA